MGQWGPQPRTTGRRPVCDGCGAVMPDPLSPSRCGGCEQARRRSRRRPTGQADRDATIGTRDLPSTSARQCAAPHPDADEVVCTKGVTHPGPHIAVGETCYVWDDRSLINANPIERSGDTDAE